MIEIEDKINKEFNNEETGLWFTNFNNVPKIVLKLPTNIIKYIMIKREVKLCFKFYLMEETNYLITGAIIEDSISNPIVVFGHTSFIKMLEEVFNSETLLIEIYDELSVSAIFGSTAINDIDRKKIIELLKNKNPPNYKNYDKNIDIILDDFQNMIAINDLKVDFILGCDIKDIIVSKNLFIGSNENNNIFLDDNEGVGFEKKISAVMDSLFGNYTYKNPILFEKNKKRELIDILAFYELGIFLIEVKASSVFNIKDSISMDRKISNLHKQIKKAINQTVGAKKALQEGGKIVDSKNVEILFDRKLYINCLIVVSEILPFGNWKEIEMMIVKTMVEEGICLNVLDLKEFMKFIKASDGSIEVFDYLLLTRREKFIENNADIHIKASFESKGL